MVERKSFGDMIELENKWLDTGELRRILFWRLRNTFTFSFPVYNIFRCQPDSLLNKLDSHGKQRFKTLTEKYPTQNWTATCNEQDYQESLYILDLCDQYLSKMHINGKDSTNLDIGSKNWGYLPGLHSFCPTSWDGIELDAHRRYWNMVTRRGYGESMAKNFPGCRYLVGPAEELQRQYSLITWFLPFITQAPHQAWGLPIQYFQPKFLLQYAWNLLQEGGYLFIINQGSEEADIQQRLFKELEIPATPLGEIKSIFSPYKKQRFGWLVNKTIG